MSLGLGQSAHFCFSHIGWQNGTRRQAGGIKEASRGGSEAEHLKNGCVFAGFCCRGDVGTVGDGSIGAGDWIERGAGIGAGLDTANRSAGANWDGKLWGTKCCVILQAIQQHCSYQSLSAEAITVSLWQKDAPTIRDSQLYNFCKCSHIGCMLFWLRRTKESPPQELADKKPTDNVHGPRDERLSSHWKMRQKSLAKVAKAPGSSETHNFSWESTL